MMEHRSLNPFKLYGYSFNPNGGFDHIEFLFSRLTLLGLSLVMFMILSFTSQNDEEAGGKFLVVALFLLLPPHIISAIRRLNDLGRKKALVLLIFIPLVNFFFFLYLISAKGKKENFVLSPKENEIPNNNPKSLPVDNNFQKMKIQEFASFPEKIEPREVNVKNLEVKNSSVFNNQKISELKNNMGGPKSNSSFWKGVITGVLVILLLLLVGYGGYYLGTRNSKNVISIKRTETSTRIPKTKTSTPKQPTKTFTPKILVTMDDKPSAEWRVPPYDSKALIVWDLDANEEWQKLVAIHAKNLAVSSPYFWEYYQFDSGTRLEDIRNHYDPILRNRGFSIGINDQDWQKITLLTYIKGPSSDRMKILLHFWEEDGESPPSLLVIYKNVRVDWFHFPNLEE
jgi:uncharacterized membrane protein YhaH (DUF805 family)